MRRKLSALAALLLLLSVSVLSAGAAPLMGADFISPLQGPWDEQREIFRRMGGEVAKVQIPAGFATAPEHVEHLIADGAKVVILRTEDCLPFYDEVRYELVDRGFLHMIERYPQIEFWLEVGNEPEFCGLDHWHYRWGLIDTITRLKPQTPLPNLHWMASMPVFYDNVVDILRDGQIAELYDGIGIHLYGDFHLGERHSNWVHVYDHVLRTTDLPLWVTEAGINDPGTPKTVKAERILSFIETLDPRVRGVTLFAIGQGSHWPQYEIDAPMADVLRNRATYQGSEPSPCHVFQETGQPLCHGFRAFWEEHGGLRIFGYPLTGEIVEDGLTVQYFERAVFEFHPNNQPPYDILLRRLGAEALERRAP